MQHHHWQCCHTAQQASTGEEIHEKTNDHLAATAGVKRHWQVCDVAQQVVTAITTQIGSRRKIQEAAVVVEESGILQLDGSSLFFFCCLFPFPLGKRTNFLRK